ncbi:MAG: glycosyltransferase [Actinomycetota bacterium]|nr:glycosyltransferase [Actinomycetota bacterium]
MPTLTAGFGLPMPCRIGMLSTYPPKMCGLATFAAALSTHLQLAGHSVEVVQIDDGDRPLDLKLGLVPRARVSASAVLVNGDPASVRSAAAVLSLSDVAIIQHEYGIFGGRDGDEVLDLIEALEVPSIVVLHTVPLLPTPHQQEVLEAICARAMQVVVMSRTAHDRLLDLYAVDPGKVSDIPHGAALPSPDTDPSLIGLPRPELLTWGLLGPGKGIEHVIDALALLADLPRQPTYTVAGVTHPKVFARDGDVYRHSLMRRASENGVAGSVLFDDTYRNVAQLTRFAASSTLVVLPYDSVDQVTSGVLVDAIAAGRPVIATAFPHARELLQTGAGIVVPHRDPAALATALRSVLTDPGRLESMTAEARRLAPLLSWSAIAGRYSALCTRLVGQREAVAS